MNANKNTYFQHASQINIFKICKSRNKIKKTLTHVHFEKEISLSSYRSSQFVKDSFLFSAFALCFNRKIFPDEYPFSYHLLQFFKGSRPKFVYGKG